MTFTYVSSWPYCQWACVLHSRTHRTLLYARTSHVKEAEQREQAHAFTIERWLLFDDALSENVGRGLDGMGVWGVRWGVIWCAVSAAPAHESNGRDAPS